jgi:hypothetical protein
MMQTIMIMILTTARPPFDKALYIEILVERQCREKRLIDSQLGLHDKPY